MLGALTSSQKLLLCLAGVGVVGPMCFFIGYLFQKTSSLGEQLNNHISGVKESIDTIGEEIHDVQNEVSGLRVDIRRFIEEFRASRSKE